MRRKNKGECCAESVIKRESKLQLGFYEWEKRVGSERGEPWLAVALGLVRANSRRMHESTSRRYNRYIDFTTLGKRLTTKYESALNDLKSCVAF